MKRKLLILVCIFMLSLSGKVSADSICVDVNLKNYMVTVSGNLGQQNVGRYVTLQIINPNKNLTDVLNGSQDVINWQDQTRIDKEGEYSFTFELSDTSETAVSASQQLDNSSTYTARVGFDSVYEKEFVFYSRQEVQSTLQRLITAIDEKNSADIEWIVLNRAELCGLDMTYFDQLNDDDDKQQVYVNMLSQKVESFDDFKTLFYDLSLVQKMNASKSDVTAYKPLLDKLKGDNSKVADDLVSGMTDEQKSEVLDAMMSTDFIDKTDVLDEYNSIVILTKINASKLWGDAYDVLIKAKDILNIDFDVCDSLKDKSSAIKRMLKVSYKDLNEIKDSFDSAVQAQKKEEDRNSDDKHSGGGGSSGGRINYTTDSTPLVTDKEVQVIFTDIEDVSWAKEAITALAKKKIINGNENNEFLPNNFITRAEFLKMVVLAFGSSYRDEECEFTDVSKESWYYPYVSAGFNTGIVTGITEDTFEPDLNISRQDIAVILYRLIKNNNISLNGEKVQFSDESIISPYAKEAVDCLSAAKIINGMGNNMFSPLESATRAQAAQLLHKLLLICGK